MMVGRGCKKSLGQLAPVGGGRKCEVVLALEVMEEAALGQTCGMADVIHRGRRIALGADHIERCAQQPGFGFVLCVLCHGGRFHTVWYGKYRPDGMLSRVAGQVQLKPAKQAVAGSLLPDNAATEVRGALTDVASFCRLHRPNAR